MSFSMRRFAAGFVLVLASFATAGTVTASPASASVAASSHTRSWWDGQTCRQFAAWERKPVAGRFRHMVQDAAHAGLFLRTDVWWWNRNLQLHASVAVIGNDMEAVYQDCNGGNGP